MHKEKKADMEKEMDAKQAAEEYKEKIAKPMSDVKAKVKAAKENKEMDKCGDMNKSSKLKNFLKKKKKTDLKKMFGRTATSAGGGGVSAPPPPAPGTSIADQIGFGKSEDKMEKARVDEGKTDKQKEKDREKRQEDFRQNTFTPTSLSAPNMADPKVKDKGMAAGDRKRYRSVVSPHSIGTKEEREKAHKQKIEDIKRVKPNLPKSEEMDKCGDMSKEEANTTKAVGLKPIASDKVKPPKSDEMPPKPKAATTLKSFMAKKKNR